MNFDRNARQTQANMPLIVSSLCSQTHISESHWSWCALLCSCSEPVDKSHAHSWGSIISPHSQLSSSPVPFFTSGTHSHMRLWYNLEHPRRNLLQKKRENLNSSIKVQRQKCFQIVGQTVILYMFKFNIAIFLSQCSWCRVKHLWRVLV